MTDWLNMERSSPTVFANAKGLREEVERLRRLVEEAYKEGMKSRLYGDYWTEVINRFWLGSSARRKLNGEG